MHSEDDRSLNTIEDDSAVKNVNRSAKRTKKRMKISITSSMPLTVNIPELNLDLLRPNDATMIDPSLGGSKILIMGKPGTGKSVLIKSLLASKQHLIPVGTVMSGSEDTNRFYQEIFPNAFIYERYSNEIIDKVHKRQKHAIAHLTNPWSALILDDCMDDVKLFNNPKFIGLMKNGRHWRLLTLIATQYCLDFKPVIRINIDGVFILREPNLNNREKIYKNFASIIPTMEIFHRIMDEITSDYTSLYIHNMTDTNDWQKCIYYYKAPHIGEMKFGCDEFWKFSQVRCK